jgi:hypothetical protein
VGADSLGLLRHLRDEQEWTPSSRSVPPSRPQLSTQRRLGFAWTRNAPIAAAYVHAAPRRPIPAREDETELRRHLLVEPRTVPADDPAHRDSAGALFPAHKRAAEPGVQSSTRIARRVRAANVRGATHPALVSQPDRQPAPGVHGSGCGGGDPAKHHCRGEVRRSRTCRRCGGVQPRRSPSAKVPLPSRGDLLLMVLSRSTRRTRTHGRI